MPRASFRVVFCRTVNCKHDQSYDHQNSAHVMIWCGYDSEFKGQKCSRRVRKWAGMGVCCLSLDLVYYWLFIVISPKEVRFLLVFVCLFVCFFVAGYTQKLPVLVRFSQKNSVGNGPWVTEETVRLNLLFVIIWIRYVRTRVEFESSLSGRKVTPRITVLPGVCSIVTSLRDYGT